MGIETEDAVWYLVFPRLQLSDLCRVRATCKTWYHSEMIMDIAKHKKADPWIMYVCPGLEDCISGCGLWAWRCKEYCLVGNNCSIDKLFEKDNCSAVEHSGNQGFNYDNWHSHYVPQGSKSHQFDMVKLSLGDFFLNPLYDVSGTSSGLLMFHFTWEKKIVLSTPLAMKNKLRTLLQPDYIDLGEHLFKYGMDDEPLCVEEHAEGFYAIAVHRDTLSKRKPDVYLDLVEVYDSRTNSWREGREYLLGTNVQHPCTPFKLGEFLILNKNRKGVATYDIEEDQWREYEFYSLLPKLDKAEVIYYVLKVKKYGNTKLLVVTVVAQEECFVQGHLSIWILEVGFTPVQLLNIEMRRHNCTVHDINVFVSGGCVAINFYTRTHLPDIVYDFELRRLYSCVNSECRRLSMRTIVRSWRTQDITIGTSETARSCTRVAQAQETGRTPGEAEEAMEEVS